MQRNQTYRLRIFVGISLVLLLLFLSFWNVENFKRTKTELQQDINDQMLLACSEYRDSIVQTIFGYMSKDTLTRKLRFPSLLHKKDSVIHMESMILEERIEGELFPGLPDYENANVSITIDEDSLETKSRIIVWQSDQSTNLKFNYSSDTSLEKLDFVEKQDSLSVKLTRLSSTTLPKAYTRLDSIFKIKLRNQHINIPHVVTNDSIEIAKAGAGIVVPFDYQSFGFEKTPVALFTDYHPYIWKKMSPSILMSLILFSVVAMSFFALLNTWLKQHRLASIKNEFVSNMTHELKTPIATIGVALEALENYGGMDDPIKRKEYLNISKHEINRLKILVDKVLKMSTMERSENMLHIEDIDVRQLTERMLNSMHLHFEKHGVHLDYQVEEASYLIKGDQIHLTNVLYNLIDNAIKYSGENPHISVQLQSNQNNVIIKVTDQGIGIDKAFQEKIFDRFFRVPTEDIHNVKGFGLGLHYVDTIVKQHGGNLELESEPGKGSQFTIKLPKDD